MSVLYVDKALPIYPFLQPPASSNPTFDYYFFIIPIHYFNTGGLNIYVDVTLIRGVCQTDFEVSSFFTFLTR